MYDFQCSKRQLSEDIQDTHIDRHGILKYGYDGSVEIMKNGKMLYDEKCGVELTQCEKKEIARIKIQEWADFAALNVKIT